MQTTNAVIYEYAAAPSNLPEANGSTSWWDKTAEEIFADVTGAVECLRSVWGRHERPLVYMHLRVSLKAYACLATPFVGIERDESVIGRLRQAIPLLVIESGWMDEPAALLESFRNPTIRVRLSGL